MKKAVIDFESYYDKDISVTTQGNRNYMRDADAYILAVAVDNTITCGTIEEMGPMCEQLASDPTIEPWAANSEFDRGWWNKYFPPTVEIDWKCALDLGAYHQCPRNLAGLSRAVLGVTVDKSTRDQMKGVHYEDLPDTGPGLTKEGVQLYCAGDVRREYELIEAMPPMSPVEERVAAHTRLINRRGVHIDSERVESDKSKLEQMKFEAFRAIPWHNQDKPLSYVALRNWCNARGIPVPKSTAKTDEDCTELMSQHPELNTVLGSMRRFRKANTLIEKIESLNARLTDDGILPLDMLFCAAPHTRRWSSKGFNIQNLDKEPTKVTEDGQTIWSREWVIPPPGKMFLILDFAQVEPRCLNWLVGNEDMMEALRHGFSYYEAYATFARNWSGAPGSLKEEYGKKKYTLLKNECLGLGYGMGVDRFIEYALQNGAVVTPADAKLIVDGFRKMNPKIVRFWRMLDNMIISASRDPQKELNVVMPSGDLLKYFSIRSKKGGGYEGYTIKSDFSGNNKQFNLWGGTLTENVTQRMSRDFLAESVIRLEDAGFPVAFHAHDEAVLIVDATDDEKKRADIKRQASEIMLVNPSWAPDLPLGVDGDFALCYTK